MKDIHGRNIHIEGTYTRHIHTKEYKHEKTYTQRDIHMKGHTYKGTYIWRGHMMM